MLTLSPSPIFQDNISTNYSSTLLTKLCLQTFIQMTQSKEFLSYPNYSTTITGKKLTVPYDTVKGVSERSHLVLSCI